MISKGNKYFLLTEFEGRTVSYGPSFFPFDLWPKREAVCLTGSRTISIHAERLQCLTHLESKTSQFEIVLSCQARFSAQFRVKESFKLLLAIKLGNTWR